MNNNEENPTTEELETPGATPEQGADDPLAVTALDLLNEQTGEEPKTDDEEPSESPTESDEDEDGEPNEGDEPTEDAEEEEELEVPSLDTAIKEALAERPELQKRWDEQWKGLLKREQKVSDFQAGINDLFGDKDYARQALPQFIGKVAEAHGLTVAELVGLGSESRSDDDAPRLADLDPDQFTDYDEQFEAYRKAYQRELQERDSVLHSLKAEVESLKNAQTEQARQAEQQKVLDQQLTRVQKVFEKEHQGFRVTRKMLADAVAEFPNLDPIRAVEAANARKLIDHRGKVTAEAQRVTAPAMIKGTTGKGIALPDNPLDIKAAHLMRD